MTRIARTFLALLSALPLLAAAQSPQSASAEKADPAAYKLLENAFLARQSLPTDLKSVSGNVEFIQNGSSFKGTFVFTKGESVKLTMPTMTASDAASLRASIGSIFGHRSGGAFADGDGKYPLTFNGGESALGKRIVLHDRLNSSYRVKGDEIIEVDRAMGGERFVVTMLENARTPEGKTLPKHFTVSYFDPETKALYKSESFSDQYSLVSGAWLPTARRVITAEKGEFTTQETKFSNMKLTRG